MKNLKYIKVLLVVGILLIIGCGSDDKKSSSDVKDTNSFSETNPIDGSNTNSTEDTNSSSETNTIDSSNNTNSTEETNNSNDTDTTDDSNTNSIETTSSGKNEFYGNWIYVDNGAVLKIDESFSLAIKRLGNNFIEITKEDGSKSMLLRNGSTNGVVRGRLYTDIEMVKKLDVKRGEKITHYIPIFKKSKNTKKYKVVFDDGFNKQSKIVSENGTFSFSGVTTGTRGKISILRMDEVLGDDEEEVADDNKTEEQGEESVVDGTKTVFEGTAHIKEEETDLGNFSIPDKVDTYNFKTTKVIDIQDKDDRYMYESRTFSGKLSFRNTGEETAKALNYKITTNDPYVNELKHEIVMGSVEANKSIEIPFEITFGRLDKIAHRVKLDFLIRDANGKEWIDYVYLDVYQTPINVNLKTKTSNLKGYFITPEHEIIDFDTKDILVKIPSRPDATYYFIVSSPIDIGAETAYSLGIDVDALEFENFSDTSAYEPNNVEEKATKLLVGDSIKSFIHKGDIDFYTIDFQEKLSYEPPRLPFN
jgi:hypothetical protein